VLCQVFWNPKDDFCGADMSFSYLIFLCPSYVNGLLMQVLGLQELQIPPRFNTYLVIKTCITFLIICNFSRHYLRNHSTSNIDICGYIDVI
jgi:hypothetical protein